MKYLSIIVLFFILSSCDKIDEPFIENNTQPIDTTIVLKKILVEDFTGHTCGNCPRAHEALQDLHQQYGERIIGVGIHIGWFAQVGGAYTYDFRTVAGNEIDAAYSIDAAGLPQGMINRRDYQGNKLIPHASWSTFIGEILNEKAKAKIEITNTYNSSDSSFSCQISSTFLDNITDEMALVVYLVEDSIVKMQKDYQASPADIPNYTHRHVLRSAINTTWGEVVSPTSLNSKVSKTYNFSFKNKDYIHSKCSTIAYLMNSSTKEIIQVEQAKIIQ